MSADDGAYQKLFGERVRELRLNAGWSQEHFAEQAKLHRTYVGGIERGERNVSLLNICAIANAFGVPPSELFFYIGTGNRTAIRGSDF
jgi:transcriptional regulator with XRE-family HTH domain